MARVGLEKLSKVFKGTRGEPIHAIKEVTLTVEDKEFLVLVGPSGCGKSTTLRLIAGLEEVSGGTISIDGNVMNPIPAWNRDIAMVFQNYALYPHMTVGENMAFGLKLRKFPGPEIEKRVREAAKMLGLLPYLDRYPKALSGGERQRVAVGRAIVRRPKVFLFDEPLSNLDAPLRTQLRGEISRLHRRLGATMIYVTHDQVEAMTLGDRIAVMKEGAIQQVADPMQVYDQPANLFVAGFIGSPPMNFFKGTILCNDTGAYFVEPTSNAQALHVRLHEQAARRLESCAGKDVILGLRPEHVSNHQMQPQRETTLTATVEVIEPMGGETCVYFVSGARRIAARLTAAAKMEVNQKVTLALDMSKAHFFDPASGLALTYIDCQK